MVDNAVKRVITRERVDALLDRIFELDAGEVTGPPGSGKTTALRSWASSTQVGEVAWLTAQSRHRDSRLLLQDLADRVSRRLPHNFPADYLRDPSVDLIATAVDRAERRVIIVIDEAERLGGADSVEVIRQLISPGRKSVRVVVGGRATPEVGFEELRRRGALVAVGEADLRLTPAETAEIVRSVSGPAIDDGQIAIIHEQIGGWALGAVLAGLVLRSSDLTAFVVPRDIDSHRYFDQYFGAEVFAVMPRHIQEFLLDTCVVEVLEPALCSELTGRTDSESVLRELERTHVFTEWIGGRPPSFRYHGLLRSWLCGCLQRVDPQRATARLRQAAQWCAANGREADAIGYRIAAGDLQLAADSIITYGPRALSEGRYQAMRTWIGALPNELVASNSALLILLAEAAHRSGDKTTTTSVRALAAGLIERRSDGRPTQLALAVIVQRARELHASGQLAAAAAEARRAIELLELDVLPMAQDMMRFDDVVLAADVSAIAAQLMFNGDWVESVRLSRWVVDTFPADDSSVTPARVSCLGKLAIAELLQGARPSASALAHEAIALCRFHNIDPIDVGFAEMASLAAEPGVDALEVHAALERRAEQMDLPAHTALGWLLRAWSYVQTDHLTEAQTTFAEAERIVTSLDEPGILASLTRRIGAIVELGADEPLLADREREVLAALAAGNPRRDVAAQLHLSLNTIKTYARRAYRALGATTLDEAVARCEELGIVIEPADAGGNKTP